MNSNAMQKNKMLKKYCKVIIALFILAVIPMIIISFYNHPSADDFSIPTRDVWRGTHSLAATVKMAIRASVNVWHNWGGIYSAHFFQALQPAIFGEKYYCIAGIAMIAAVILSNVIAAWYLVRGVLGGGRLEAVCIASMMSFAMLEWLPSPVEGIYWFNGAVNYTPYHTSLMAIACLMIEIFRSFGKQDANKRSCTPRLILMSAAVVLLGAYQGGGNQQCSFAGALAMLVFLASAIYLKDKRRIELTAVLFLAVGAFFLLNVLSPGTAVRQAVRIDLGIERPGAVKAILLSVLDALGFVVQWTTLRVLCLLLLALFVIVPLMSGFCKRSTFAFSLPFFVALASLGWISALCCPIRYAGGRASGRVANYVYYSYVALLFFNEVYFAGFLYRLNEASNIVPKIRDAARDVWLSLGSAMRRKIKCVLLAAGALVLVHSLKSSDIAKTTSTARAIGSVFIFKSAQQYSKECYERVKIYEASKGKDVAVKEFSEKPRLILFDDITEDPADWRNMAVSKYYGLKSVVLEKEQKAADAK